MIVFKKLEKRVAEWLEKLGHEHLAQIICCIIPEKAQKGRAFKILVKR